VLLHFDFKVQQYQLNLRRYRDGYREKCPVHGVSVAVGVLCGDPK
jgi:hypothetical protein